MVEARKWGEEDWKAICRIYRQGMDTNLATFEAVIPPYEKWDESHLQFGRFAAVHGGQVVGWVALSPTSRRKCFSGVAELSIYIANEAKHMGVGTLLLNQEIADSQQHGIWTLQAGIMRNNAPSLALHRKCGFREVGVREKIARDPFGNWRDMVLMEWRNPNIL